MDNIQKEEILENCRQMFKNTLMETLDIEIIDITEDYVLGKMPVTPKVHQPDGVLHGGASVAFAETIGSMASFLLNNSTEFVIRGIEISANHIKSIREGWVFAKASAIHKGRTTQLWEIKITDEADNLISLVKLTTLSLPKNS
ncbi:hotdog fold thioesterase [Gillisia hiemivivida]